MIQKPELSQKSTSDNCLTGTTSSGAVSSICHTYSSSRIMCFHFSRKPVCGSNGLLVRSLQPLHLVNHDSALLENDKDFARVVMVVPFILSYFPDLALNCIVIPSIEMRYLIGSVVELWCSRKWARLSPYRDA